MNDREISDFDKLKNLLTEFGIHYKTPKYYDDLEIIEISDGYSKCEFRFTEDAEFYDFKVFD
jgi:hypothetical protein